MSTPIITDIPGIGPSMAAVLSKNGFKTIEDIAASDVKSLCAIPRFGPNKAKTTIAAAVKLATPKKSTSSKKSKDKPKSKKSKKDSKSDKKDKKDKKSSKKSKSKHKAKKSDKKKKKKSSFGLKGT